MYMYMYMYFNHYVTVIPLLFIVTGLHFAYQHVSKWFLVLSKSPSLLFGVWSASDDEGYDSFFNFLVQKSGTKPIIEGKGKKEVLVLCVYCTCVTTVCTVYVWSLERKVTFLMNQPELNHIPCDS